VLFLPCRCQSIFFSVPTELRLNRGGSSSSFGVTVSNTAPGATVPTTPAGSSSGASAPTGSNFGNSGLPVRLNVNKGFMASAVLSLVAGAAVVAL
jgi:hypothetical protein